MQKRSQVKLHTFALCSEKKIATFYSFIGFVGSLFVTCFKLAYDSFLRDKIILKSKLIKMVIWINEKCSSGCIDYLYPDCLVMQQK